MRFYRHTQIGWVIVGVILPVIVLLVVRGGPRNSDSMLRWLPPFDREDRSNEHATQILCRLQGQGRP